MEHIRPQSGGHVASGGEAQHEGSDVNIKAILGFGAFLVISGIILHFVFYGFYLVLDREIEKQNPPGNPMVKVDALRARALCLPRPRKRRPSG